MTIDRSSEKLFRDGTRMSYLSMILVNAAIVNALLQEHGSKPASAKSNDIAELRGKIAALREELKSARQAATDR